MTTRHEDDAGDHGGTDHGGAGRPTDHRDGDEHGTASPADGDARDDADGDDDPDEAPQRERFDWRETAARLRALSAELALAPEPGARAFTAARPDGSVVRFVPPLVLPIARGQSAVDYLDALRERLGVECVVLYRAGAAALGLWHDDELVLHKVFKRYAVRGRGKAQPTHLRQKGKSRYGSRLRLQNARALLDEVGTRLRTWHRDDGPLERVYYGSPERMWSELLRAEPTPLPATVAAIRIPLHVHTPDFEELLRVRRALVRGTIEHART